MDKVLHWFEEYPELFGNEKRILFEHGYKLDERALETERVVRFTGFSLSDPAREIMIEYPHGYPSFAPTVSSSPQKYPVLCRHHDPLSGHICCFGFGQERWNASYTALHVIIETENIIKNYPLNGNIPDDDIVPEPKVCHVDYSNSSILIPYPFSNYNLHQMALYDNAKLRIKMEKNNIRGILTHLNIGKSEEKANAPFIDWYQGERGFQRRNAIIKVLSESPTFPTNFKDISIWLKDLFGYPVFPKQQKVYFFIFPDEWGQRNNIRQAWVGLYINNCNAKWLHCYLVHPDDAVIRTPFGSTLKDKTVLIIGCGSLGSSVAVSLAQEGIKKIILVDFDIYEPGNSIRHQLGMRSFGFSKVNALKARIMDISPTCQVSPIIDSIGHMTDEEFIPLIKEADIIVDTTGAHSTAHYLNWNCIKYKKPLIIGSVTNGIWSCEVFRYRPGISGCWSCWQLRFGSKIPPSAPNNTMQFAPGCNQPTFVGGAADVYIASGLISRVVTETLVNLNESGKDYILLINRQDGERWEPKFEYFPVSKDERCQLCRI